MEQRSLYKRGEQPMKKWCLPLVFLALVSMVAGCGGPEEFSGTWRADKNCQYQEITFYPDNQIGILNGDQKIVGTYKKLVDYEYKLTINNISFAVEMREQDGKLYYREIGNNEQCVFTEVDK
jgi:hypothetical protein